eukprot:jgi/Phyca11/116652/e_gw1.31.548.1
MWKDKLLAHANQLDHVYQAKPLEKRQPKAKVLMADFLRRQAGVVCRVLDKGKEDLHLLNQVSPNFFLSTLPGVVSSMDPCEVIRLHEKGHGQDDAAGLIELTRAWTKMTRSPWCDVRPLFAQSKKAKNEINRKPRKLWAEIW